MAADVSVESVLLFLRRCGGRVSNAELLIHFRRFLREHEDREHHRETFKRCVNTVATVQHEGGVAYVSLKTKYRTHSEPTGPRPTEPPRVLLPVAGILNNNNNNIIKDVQTDVTSQTGQDRGRSQENILPPPAVHESSGQNISIWPVAPGPTHSSISSSRSHDTPTIVAPPIPTQQALSHHDEGLLRTDRMPGPRGPVENMLPPPAVHASGGQNIYIWPVSPGPPQDSAASLCSHDTPTIVAPPLYAQRASGHHDEGLLRTDQVPGPHPEEPEDHGALYATLPEDGGLRTVPSIHSLDSELDQENWSSENVLNRPSRSSGLLTPEDLGAWHSTGHLMDDEPHAGSAPPHGLRARPMARRLSHHLRSRMCRSLGADLDRAFREDADAARLRRLQRVTSFLNVASVPTSRAHSPLGSMSSSSSLHSLGHDVPPYVPRPPQVPLEPQEHEWFVKAAAGNWTEVYALFREEPGLLGRRDLVSGFTVLHWIAKHGDHRVLNTLGYGVTKVGAALDVNVRSTCGYTPLHLAAIHGHKNLLRLLVNKFKANVALRDNSGRRAWQYLERSDDRELMELLGAHKGAWRGGGGTQWALDKPPAGPGVKTSAAVKRHASLAALFKNKSNLRVAPHMETSL